MGVEARPEPDSGNPTVRDRREASENVIGRQTLKYFDGKKEKNADIRYPTISLSTCRDCIGNLLAQLKFYPELRTYGSMRGKGHNPRRKGPAYST